MVDNHEVDFDPLTVQLEGRARFCTDRGEVKTPELLREAKARISALEEENRRLREAARKADRRLDALSNVPLGPAAAVVVEAHLYLKAALSQEEKP